MHRVQHRSGRMWEHHCGELCANLKSNTIPANLDCEWCFRYPTSPQAISPQKVFECVQGDLSGTPKTFDRGYYQEVVNSRGTSNAGWFSSDLHGRCVNIGKKSRRRQLLSGMLNDMLRCRV